MGVEPFLIASTVNTIIGQRLVRTVPEEKDSYASSKTETEAILATIGAMLPKSEAEIGEVAKKVGHQKLPLASQSAYTLYRGRDSKDAPGGYKGRMGLYEVIEVTEAIEELIMSRATSGEIMKLAQKQGTISMRQDGYFKALEGLTTLEEVNRVAALGSE